MGWNDWPYWLKGGVVGEIFLILYAISDILYRILEYGGNCPEHCLAYLDVMCPTSFTLFHCFRILIINPKGNLIFMVFFFIIGAIIGYIYGRIKKPHQNSLK